MSRRKPTRLRLSPSWLPVIRDHLVAEGRKQTARGTLNGPVNEEILRGLYAELDVLAQAPLWWVSKDMKTLCVDTVINGPRPPVEPYPTATGLIAFEGGFIVNSSTAGPITVNAVSWELDYKRLDSDGLPEVLFRLFSSDDRIVKGKLIDTSLPIGPVANLTDEAADGAVLAMMQVAFALMSQPSVTEVRSREWDAASDGPQPRSLRHAPPVKMIVLREPPHRAPAPGDGPKRRELSHRFIVRGFYRMQPYGPRHSLRRRQWIPPFVKGPVDAPLVVKESVRIWRNL